MNRPFISALSSIHMLALKLVLLLSIFLLPTAQTLWGQVPIDSTKFVLPVKIPVFFSGNFGELRASHFHAGIDIKTQGKTGFPIYSIDEGYVYRINISGGGYGNALYVRHPNGYSSVYAHLEAFSPEIEKKVLQLQYEKQKFDQNIFPAPDEFTVTKGQQIGLSGNTGRSGGPHLHFEIRDSQTEEPLNPFFFYPHIIDTTPPVINRIAIYPLSDSSWVNGSQEPFIFDLKKLPIDNQVTVEASGTIGFGIDATEYLSGSNNRCGLYTIELLGPNGEILYTSQIDRLNFSQNRMILSHVDYAQRKKNGHKLQKSFLQAGNSLSIYQKDAPGTFPLSDTSTYRFTYRIHDFHGNADSISFRIKSVASPFSPTVRQATPNYPVVWNEATTLEFNEVKIQFPAKALFETIDFEFEACGTRDSLVSEVYRLHRADVPLFRPFRLSIPYQADTSLLDKAFILQLDTLEGKPIRFSQGGESDADRFISTRSYDFGYFAIGIDTVAPKIKILNPDKDYGMIGKIEIFAKDELTGISHYEAYLDDTWILFRYDAKYDYYYHLLEDLDWERGKVRTLRFIAEDAKGNRSELIQEIIY